MIGWTLVLLLESFGASADETQAKPATSAAPAQDPDRPTIPAAELKALRENNIFAPRAVTIRPRTPKGGPNSTRLEPPAKPKAPLITGFFLDEKTKAPCVIVEDRNDASRRFFKEPKFLKAGDEWGGYKVESVTLDKAVFNKGGAPKEVTLGEPLPNFEGLPLQASAEDEFGDDGETSVPSESGTSSSPAPGKKGNYRGRTDSRTESKTSSPESQSQTLENMKRRVKKNRPSDPDE